MTQIVNFKRLDVTGATKQEALNKAPFEIMGDATQAYRNWIKTMKNGITDSDKKQFMLDYLTKKSKNIEGAGFYITNEAAVADTRERPWTITDVKNKKGARKYTTVFNLVDESTGTVLAKCHDTKADAKDLAKKLISEGFHGKITCYYHKEVTEGEPIAFEIEYTPSKSAKFGSYTVFGIERN